MPLFHDFFVAPRPSKEAASEPFDINSNEPQTRPVQMNLEERMAFRRELLFNVVRTALAQNQIDPHDYHFKIVRIDRRGHCFVVMLDMLPAFMQSPRGQHAHLSSIADSLTRSAMARFGLVVSGVYWRIDESLQTSANVALSEPASTNPPADSSVTAQASACAWR